MAQLIPKKRNELAAAFPDKTVTRSAHHWDIQVYLHNLWLAKMATSQLYDDVTIPHGWRCRCCSRTLFLSEERKR